jgi:predicted MPP superfamily phosphohydrolase
MSKRSRPYPPTIFHLRDIFTLASILDRMRKFIGGALLGAGALAAYSLYEPYRFRLVHHQIPGRPDAPGLRILHISDSHLTRKDRHRAAYLQRLPALVGEVPDLVLATGDMIEDDSGIDLLLDSLDHYEAKLGKFYVLGSHDYFRAEFKLPTKYFTGRKAPVPARRADTARLEEGLAALGWRVLTNRTEHVEAPGGGQIRLAGVDDPYLRWQRTGHIERAAGEKLAIGLVHSPDVVSDYLLHGFDLVVGGHTHGGQVRAPFVGALVTNCSLPRALAAGLHRIGNGWLHVTPGLGTSRFTPIRFLCRPEAAILEIVPG